MATKYILVVEDDKNISKLVRYNLEKAGFGCILASSGEKALELLKTQAVDAVILDLMLPGIDGLEVCRNIRQDNKLRKLPVIMLTAKREEIDRVVGFEVGADDYVVKPFSPRELLLRVKAILKRRAPEVGDVELLKSGDVEVDKTGHSVTVRKKPVELTAMEFKLLVTLMERAGRVQSRDRLLVDVWGMDTEVDTRTIDMHVTRLRDKLGKSGAIIETVRGMGYKFRDEDED